VRATLSREFGVAADAAVPDRFDAQEVIVLAIKPQHMLDAARALRPRLGTQLVVSIAAGIRTRDLSRWLGGYEHIVRVMPNTPALVLAGISALFAMPAVTADARSLPTICRQEGTCG
jgi:pyrroline-5-carboxylate reductase